MVSNRRRGGENSAMRAALIEAAEQLIREEGYPAVTSRNLADRVNLKRQIVHYYFHSMDDLFIAVIRRGADKARAQLEAAGAAEDPLRALWAFNRDPAQSILSMELNALANRRPAVRAEVAHYATEFRDLQTRILVDHLKQRGIEPSIDPLIATVLLTTLSQVLSVESAIDVSRGHAETLAFVDECLRAFAEGRPGPAPLPRDHPETAG